MREDYKIARDNFVQKYDPTLTCCVKDKSLCTADVTEYYFSSGETCPICTYHVDDSDCMRTDGHNISVQYYNEVYKLRSVFVYD